MDHDRNICSPLACRLLLHSLAVVQLKLLPRSILGHGHVRVSTFYIVGTCGFGSGVHSESLAV